MNLIPMIPHVPEIAYEIFEYHKKLVANGKPIIHISFSGGRTSGYMADWLIKNFSHAYNFIVTYANTGLEVEETLEFIRQCDEQKGFKTMWLEAVIHAEKGVGTTHRMIDFHTAVRGAKIFSEMVAKFGIPNIIYKHCTRELKVRAMNSYLKSLGLKPNKVPTAIGIRADEASRCSSSAASENLIYPLVKLHSGHVDKEFVLNYWAEQAFDLQIEEHDGNCMMCFEKSFPKLMRQVQERPEAIEMFIEMEKLYGGINNKNGKDRVFFRKNISAQEVKDMKEPPKGKPVKNPSKAA